MIDQSNVILKVRGLKKNFGKLEVLKGIDLDIYKGEVVAIIGPSGGGKSTFLRCLNMLETPTEGDILFEGNSLVDKKIDINKHREKIGMVFQLFNLFKNKNVLDNVTLALTRVKKMKKPDAEAIARRMLDRVGILDKEKEFPSKLSGGQKQRVAIARALATTPKILLCDEATSALDPATTESILSLIKDINRRLGITAIIITHEMSVIEKICNQVAIISHGRIAETGSVEEVFFHPQTEEARQLVIPEALQDMPHSRLYRIIFNGRSSFEPVISNLVLECGAPVNIMFADTRDIGGTAFGQMVLQLPD